MVDDNFRSTEQLDVRVNTKAIINNLQDTISPSSKGDEALLHFTDWLSDNRNASDVYLYITKTIFARNARGYSSDQFLLVTSQIPRLATQRSCHVHHCNLC